MLLAQTANNALIMALIALSILANIVILVVVVRCFLPWMQTFMSGVPVRIFDIIGMRLRRTNVKAVLTTLIAARHAGVTLSCREVEQAYLQGADLDKLTLAVIQAQKRGLKMTFDELVQADLEGRFEEKFGQPTDSSSATATAQEIKPRAGHTEVRDARICRKCSARVSDDNKICPHCGAIL